MKTNSERDLLESMLQEKELSFRSLKEVSNKQESLIEKIQAELNEVKAKQKELQDKSKMEVKELSLQKDLVQKRLDASLEKQMTNSEKVEMLKYNLKVSSAVQSGRSEEVSNIVVLKNLQSSLTKSIRYICTLEKQLEMLKKDSDSIIRKLKVNINEAREERSRDELELLNQLAKLDREKVTVEDELQMRLQNQSDQIQKLREELQQQKNQNEKLEANQNTTSPKSVNTSHFDMPESPVSPSEMSQYTEEEEEEEHAQDCHGIPSPPLGTFKFEENLESRLMEQINTLSREKACMEHDLRHELRLQRETITRLEKNELDNTSKIQRLEDIIKEKNLEIEQTRTKVEEEIRGSIEFVMEGQRAALLGLERVSAIREKTDTSIALVQTIEADDTELSKDCKQILNKSKLLFEEIKISLSSIELQLKNQNSSLRTISSSSAHSIDANDNDSLTEDQISLQSFHSISNSGSYRNETLFLQTKVKNMQENILSSLRTIERNYKQKFSSLVMEVTKMYDTYEAEYKVKCTTVQTLEQTISELEQSISIYKHEINNSVRENNEINELQADNITLTNALQDKEDELHQLSSTIQEHEIREEMLKAEIKKLKSKVKNMEVDDLLSDLERSSSYGKE